jgi:hypothetical protein
LAELGPVLVDRVVSVVVEPVASLRLLAELRDGNRLRAAIDLLADPIDLGQGLRTADVSAASRDDQTEESDGRAPPGTRWDRGGH